MSFVFYWILTHDMRLILLLLLLIPVSVCAQQETAWEQALREVVGEEDIDSEQWEQMTDLLTDYAEHPIDLNHTSREDLEQLPFLSFQQVMDIIEYLDRYGPMRSLNTKFRAKLSKLLNLKIWLIA